MSEFLKKLHLQQPKSRNNLDVFEWANELERPYDAILLSNTKEWTTDTHNYLYEFPGY